MENQVKNCASCRHKSGTECLRVANGEPRCPPFVPGYPYWEPIVEKTAQVKTLLDEFAMAAMEGLMAMPANVVIDGKKTTSLSGYATASYGMAFYMMKERARRDEMGNVKEVK